MNAHKSPLDQVFESYESETQPPDVPQAVDYPHPYHGHAPASQNNSSDLGVAANILAAVAHIPFCLIGLITSIIILIAIKDNKLARFYAFQSLLLHGTLIIGYIVSLAVIMTAAGTNSSELSTLGAVLYITTILIVMILFLVSIVMGLIGKIFKIPLIGKLADKWSG